MNLVAYKDPKVIVKEIKRETPLHQALEELQKSTLRVAQVAENLANNADRVPAFLADYLIDVDDMDNLRTALNVWKKASDNLLKQL